MENLAVVGFVGMKSSKERLNTRTLSKFKTILLYIFFALSVGCKSKQKSIYIEKVKDSTVRNIVLQTNNELIISSLCDTITGKAIEFSQDVKTGNSNFKVTSKDNRLQIATQNDSIVYVDKIYKEEIYVDNEVIRYRTDWRIILILSGAIILFIIFPIVPKSINTFVRRFVAWF